MGLEERRAERMSAAYGKKLPKLLAHSESTTVLVVENRDMSLANEGVISAALRAAAPPRRRSCPTSSCRSRR
jgi:hypothetical protein